MTDISNVESAIKTAATVEVATVKSKALAFLKAHLPAVVSAVAGYAGGHYGVIGAVLKHLF